MSQLARTFVIRSAEDAQRLIAFLKLNAPAAIEHGEPLEATIRVHRPKASDAQRALIWIVLGQIAEQAWIAGRQFDAETWAEHSKRELLPEQTTRGVQKWRITPKGDRELNMSTEHLDRREKTDYIDALLAMAASLGVTVEIQSKDHV